MDTIDATAQCAKVRGTERRTCMGLFRVLRGALLPALKMIEGWP
jgi:hypothetical protein